MRTPNKFDKEEVLDTNNDEKVIPRQKLLLY